MSQPLWIPSAQRIAYSNLIRFMQEVDDRYDVDCEDYEGLWRWSVAHSEKFWDLVWEFCGVIASEKGERIVENLYRMPGCKFFPDAKINYAENLLRQRGDGIALIFHGEDKVRKEITHDQLYDQVARLQRFLKAQGVGAGDRVAGFVPNAIETIVAMLAVTSLGGIWTSCSPDFGVNGVVDRFGQIEPKILFAADGYFYAGKTLDSVARIAEFTAQLPSIQKIIVWPYVTAKPDLSNLPKSVHWAEALEGPSGQEVEFTPRGFNDPLFIMYSSGTTGKPKCIVHGIGGTLIQHLKEHQLNCDLKPGDRLFYFTTCGWMMWNWLVSGLASNCTLVLYDGSPFHPDGNRLFDLADLEQMTVLGTSAKFIDAALKGGIEPKKTHKLTSVRAILSTGSPLAPEGFDWVYNSVKQDVCLSSISGGTDIVSCFMLGNPIGPVWRGEIQKRGLGMKVEVFDDHAKPMAGGKGELVCSMGFPCMPIGFWNDTNDEKYKAAYFGTWPDIWHHGDYVELTDHGGIIVYGRSDATLNPGGVRIGTAEIYRQVEQLEEIAESLVIGQDWDHDVRVVLFVRLQPGHSLDDALKDKIKKQIRTNCTPRHVPAKIIAVADIPRTKSGKITELAVRDTVHGRPIKNKEALANPEALDLYVNIPELQV